ncbi:hypothetical protein PLICRDRAFT_678286 [Plicaturopsis crispa FD-325 SS-3]|nr:hypothetical protein PLICRDRAFT_678286 [Plicaturopsis crispa FD-325 SS-3]
MGDVYAIDVPCTKRDMYYRDVQLFKTQSVVDRLVDDVAATFGVQRADLNVRATAKGLVSGAALTLHLRAGGVLRVADGEGTLIPPAEDIARIEVDTALRWVLVVEKDAVFQTLCRARLAAHPALPGPGLVITGKGYPDIATRELVCALADNLPESTPLLALVDADAYGLHIWHVYTHGSRALRHERARLAAGRVRWGGVGRTGLPLDALLPITAHDEKKARAMLVGAYRRELQKLLHTRRKAEIEVLDRPGGEGVVAYAVRIIGEALR